MKHVVRMALVLAVLCGPVLSAPPDTDAETFPLMEKYLRKGKIREYVADAMAFVAADPKSPYAPRVVFDLHLLAGLQGDASRANVTRIALVLHYSDSPYGMHLFNAFKDGEAYRTFLQDVLNGWLDEMNDAKARSLVRGIRRGAARFKDGFLKDNTFLLKCILLARQVGDTEMARALSGRLRAVLKADKAGMQADLAKVVAVCLASNTAAADRVAKLDAMTDNGYTHAFKRYFLSRLSGAEWRLPTMIRIAAALDVDAARFEQALAKIASLPAKHVDAQVLFWKASCLFADGKVAEAREALAEVSKQPAGPWRTTGEQYAACLKTYDENLQASVTTILAVLARFRDKAEVVECEAEVLDEKSSPLFRAYVAAVPGDNVLEIMLLKKGKIIVAYRTDAEGTRIYAQGSESILLFPGTAVVPTLRSSLTRDEDGRFNFNMDMGFSTSLQQSAQASEGLWNSPYLTTRAGLLAFLGYGARRHGWMPLSVVKGDGGTVLTWGAFDKEISRIAFHVNADNVLTDIRAKGFRIRRLRYGPKAAITPAGPKWPDLKVRRAGKDEIPLAVFGQIFSQLLQAFGELAR